MTFIHHRTDPKIRSVTDGNVFAGCTPKQRQRLDSLATVVTVPAGRDLTVQGQRGREFGVVLDGEAIVEIDGTEVARLGSGDHYGELALLDDAHRRRATVTTLTETTVAAMSVREFQQLLHEMPEIANRIMQSALARTAANNR